MLRFAFRILNYALGVFFMHFAFFLLKTYYLQLITYYFLLPPGTFLCAL